MLYGINSSENIGFKPKISKGEHMKCIDCLKLEKTVKSLEREVREIKRISESNRSELRGVKQTL